jgi:hypothetical protein
LPGVFVDQSEPTHAIALGNGLQNATLLSWQIEAIKDQDADHWPGFA